MMIVLAWITMMVVVIVATSAMVLKIIFSWSFHFYIMIILTSLKLGFILDGRDVGAVVKTITSGSFTISRSRRLELVL
jgi:hypothetical protein